MDARYVRWRLGRGRRLLAGKTTVSKLEDNTFFQSSLVLHSSMASLRATLEALLFAYCEEWLDDMEYLVLNELNTSENLDFSYDSYDQFNLNDMDEAECIAELHFEKRHSAIRRSATDPSSNEVQAEISFHWNRRTLHAFEKACLPL